MGTSKATIWRACIRWGVFISLWAILFTEPKPAYWGFSELQLTFYFGVLLIAVGTTLGVLSVAARRSALAEEAGQAPETGTSPTVS